MALYKHRMEKKLRERTAQLEALRRVGLEITTELDLDALLHSIVSEAAELLGGDAAGLYLYRPEREVLEWTVSVGPEVAPVGTVFRRGEGLSGKVWESGDPLIVGDYEHWEERAAAGESYSGQDVVGVPVRWGEAFIGVLNVRAAPPRVFSSDDVELLGLFATQAAIAIQNARLHRELEGYAGQLEQLVAERTAELEAQYARSEAILNSITEGVVVTGGGGQILQANPVAQTWLERSLVPEDAKRLREAVRDLAANTGNGAASGERAEAVLELRGLDLELRSAPISGPGMEELTAVALHDVSHLKALDRMKSRFITNISHELRTPITTIKLYAELMQRQPEKWEKFLVPLALEAEHQALLVQSILEIARIDAGRVEMAPRPTSLNELTEAAVAGHRTRAQERRLELEHRPAQPGPVALVDPVHMAQVLNNLVDNAIRFTPEEGRVAVSTGTEEADGRAWATVTVADTGLGIPEDELPHIFERFFRGEEPRAMQSTGTGLGLAIVKDIVDLHGGQVTVESQAGKGSTFIVWLPLAG
jgi:two-component system NtrC family sensor kinase